MKRARSVAGALGEGLLAVQSGGLNCLSATGALQLVRCFSNSRAVLMGMDEFFPQPLKEGEVPRVAG